MAQASSGWYLVVYLRVDGIYVKAGLEKGKAALLVAIGGLSDGRKVVLAEKSFRRLDAPEKMELV